MHHHLNKQFYHKAVFENGFTPQGLGWHSRASQEVRFHQILALLPDSLDSVVDTAIFASIFAITVAILSTISDWMH